MTAYYITFAVVVYFLVLADLTRRRPEHEFDPTPASIVSRSLLFIACAILALVAGLRWRVGTDYGGYARGYESFKEAFVSDLLAFNEPGIKGLAVLTSWVFDDYAAFILLASLVTVGLMLRTITKNSPAVAFSVTLFVLTGLWHGSFNGVRQMLAVAIVLAGHRYVVDRKPFRFVLVILAASLFHVSALPLVGLYFIPRRKLGWFGTIGIIGASLLALYFSDAALALVEAVKGNEITTAYATRAINPLRVAVAVAPLALYYLGKRDDAADGWFYRNMAVVHAGVIIAASWSAYLTRFGIYTAAFIPLALPRLVKFSDPTVTRLGRFAVVVLFAIYWFNEVAPDADLNNFNWVFERQPL